MSFYIDRPLAESAAGDDEFAAMIADAGIGEGMNHEFGNFVVGWLSLGNPDELKRAMAGYRRLLDARKAAA